MTDAQRIERLERVLAGVIREGAAAAPWHNVAWEDLLLELNAGPEEPEPTATPAPEQPGAPKQPEFIPVNESSLPMPSGLPEFDSFQAAADFINKNMGNVAAGLDPERAAALIVNEINRTVTKHGMWIPIRNSIEYLRDDIRAGDQFYFPFEAPNGTIRKLLMVREVTDRYTPGFFWVRCTECVPYAL